MAKRSRTDLIQESIITLHFASPTTPEEMKALSALKLAEGKKYLKTVERSKMIAEWYRIWKAVNSEPEEEHIFGNYTQE